MRVVKAHEIIAGLDAPQRKRLFSYSRKLRSDRDPKFFDSRMYADLLSCAKDKKRIMRVKSYLDRIGFNQSRYEYKKIQESIEKFTQPDHSSFRWNANYIKAKNSLIEEFRKFNLFTIRYYSDKQMVQCLPRKDTHAGFSYILTGDRTKGDYLDDIFRRYRTKYFQALEEKSFNSPILIGSRTQASGAFSDDGEFTNKFKSKTRMVSMIDIYQIFAELVFAKPVQMQLSDVSWYAGGKDDFMISSIVYSQSRGSRSVLSLDYSSYDQTISSWLIDDAFDIIRAAFPNDRSFDEQLFSIVRKDFINKVFIDGDMNIIESHKGVPSGSMFTQIIDSIVNRLMIKTFMYSKQISDYDMMIMGDDNLLMVHEDVVTKEEISTYITKNFGILCNPDKCAEYSYPEKFQFLSRYWTLRGIWRTPEILISKLLYPERFRDYIRNDSLEAHDIIQSYILSFRRGMAELIDVEKYETENVNLKQSPTERARYLSGLERYRLLYL